MHVYPYTITISSEKGGVGKTTLATNLAIYLKAMHEDLPVTIFSFDNHFTIDKMFELTKRAENFPDVRTFLMGAEASKVVQTGQYGVNFIRSSDDLEDIYEHFKGPMTLTRMLAESRISGIVIIDTRPDLNILTQNALYAADRVLIPVKDLPSLENCKNIFALFDQRGIDKRSLELIPCLVDSRIKFEGLFKDQKTLLRAIAVNRGYRCMDTYISKSPKVESLNTNPEGKIYPILTHARGTEVHGQFMKITHNILRSIDSTKETRACLYHTWLLEKEAHKKESYLARLEGMAERCLICGALLAEHQDDRSFYFETSDRSARGFLHGSCVSSMLCSALYNMQENDPAFDTARAIVADKASRGVSILLPRIGPETCSLDYRQFNMVGEQLLQKSVEMPGFDAGELNGVHDRLYLLLNEALAGFEGALREESWLSVYPVDPVNPEAVLHEDSYKTIHRLQKHFTETVLAI